MLAAVFGSATSEETTRPSATPPIAVMNMMPRSIQNIPRICENVIADQDEKHALEERKHAEGDRFRENIIRQPNVEISLPLEDSAITNNIVRAVRQAKEHRDDQAEKQKRRNVISGSEIVCPASE